MEFEKIVFFGTTIMSNHKKRFASHYKSVIITGLGCETGTYTQGEGRGSKGAGYFLVLYVSIYSGVTYKIFKIENTDLGEMISLSHLE